MDALNGYTVDHIKSKLSKLTGHPVENIRLHGSRIHGIPKPDSDLDVAILDENMEMPSELYYIHCCDMLCEISNVPLDYYSDEWKVSWLRYSA